jgi:succinate dehydrogenase/fumarate reductase flavoprotein subunit
MQLRDLDVLAAETDVLILGGGITGYRAAIAAREAGRNVTMAFMAHGSSPYIIGANIPLGAADPNDGPDVYAEDMLRGGYHLNDTRLVRALAENAIPAFRELERLNVPFARNGSGVLQRHLSGNTYPRSVYVPEGTGRVILNHLKQRAVDLGIEIMSGWKVLSLMRRKGSVVGALVANRHDRKLVGIGARATVLTMGGIGRIYDDSTYPADIASDSYALAYDAGARLIDMEFVQFEPVVTVWPEACRGMEMPTAMFGDGAQLINAAGERFMQRYNPEHAERRIEKARMSLCIQQEIDEGRGFPDGTILFDTTKVTPDLLETYVSHCKRLRAAGVDPAVEGVRVRPAAHSQMGGIFIDENGWSGIPGFYAGGEATGGVHGASRLAGNGGAETIVFGGLVGRGAAKDLLPSARYDWPQIRREASAEFIASERDNGADADEIKVEVRRIMKTSAGLYRERAGLMGGIDQIRNVQAVIDSGLRVRGFAEAIAALEARNVALTARLILESALAREESRGAHQRRDYRDQNDEEWRHHLAFSAVPSSSEPYAPERIDIH